MNKDANKKVTVIDNSKSVKDCSKNMFVMFSTYIHTGIHLSDKVQIHQNKNTRINVE